MAATVLKNGPSFALVGRQTILLAVLKEVARRHNAVAVHSYPTLAEMAFGDAVSSLSALVIDGDSYPVSAEDICDQRDCGTCRLPILLVQRVELSPTKAERMPACVKRIIHWDGGWFLILRGVQDFLRDASMRAAAE